MVSPRATRGQSSEADASFAHPSIICMPLAARWKAQCSVLCVRRYGADAWCSRHACLPWLVARGFTLQAGAPMQLSLQFQPTEECWQGLAAFMVAPAQVMAAAAP